MNTVHVVEGGRHPAVLDVPTGNLTVQAQRAGEIKLSLVIPTFNESRNLEELVARLASVLDVCLPGRYELIVVDDDSPDQTWAVGLRLPGRFSRLRGLRPRAAKRS